MAPRTPRKEVGPTSDAEFFLELSESLRNQAARPNIYGYTPHFKQIKFHSVGHLTPDNKWKPVPPANAATGGFEPLVFKTSLTKIRLYIGGNRSGKTVGGIIEDIWWVSKTHPFIDINAIWPEPIRGRICSVDFKQGVEKIIIPEILRWCPRSYLRGGSWITAYDKETNTLWFANGGFIEFMSYDQDVDKFAGTSRHFIHFDEEPPEEIYLECMARLVDTGGCAWFTMTPVEGMTWIFDRIYEPGITEGASEDESGVRLTILVVEVDMFDNPFVSDEEKNVFISLLDKNDIEARVHGKFVRRGGLIYAGFDEKIHVIEGVTPNRDYLWVSSLDHGFRNPTAWLWHAVNYEGRVITFHEHYASGLVIAEHAKIVNETNKTFGRQPDYFVGDPSIQNKNPISGTSVWEEYAKFGIPIILGNNDVQGGIIRVARYLKPQADEHGNQTPYWLITENCTNLIWEIKRYRWASWAHKRTEQDHNAKEEPVKKDDHALDSARYFFMSRPDLKADPQSLPENQYEKIAQAIGGASKPVSLKGWEEPTAEDWEGKTGQTTWNREYATSADSGWQVEEVMGGEW